MARSIAIFDIDGTLRRTVDPWMFLHGHLGTAEQGRKFYKSWINGEITYSRMTELDASIWKNIEKKRMVASLDGNPIRKGAHQLIEWFKGKDVPCVGISTGLSFLNDITSNELGLDEVISNDLIFYDGICTGDVTINVQEDSKAHVLNHVLNQYGIDGGNIISFGDGPADIPMFRLSTISVAVFPRSKAVLNEADLVVNSEPIDVIIEQLAEIRP